MPEERKFLGRTKGYTSVRLSVLLHIAWKNLVSKKLRAMLTIFGVVIGIAAIFFLLSFGLGLQQLVTTQVIGDQSVKSIDVTSPNSKLIHLNNAAVNKMKVYPHVEKVGIQHSFPGSLESNGGEIDSVVYGVDAPYLEMASISTVAGRLLNKDDTKSILINSSVLEAIGIKDKDKAIDKTIEITVPLKGSGATKNDINDTFKIIGVIDSGSGTEVFIPSSNFSIVGIDTFQNVKIIADDASNVQVIRKQVESSGFQTTSPVDTLDQINQIFKFFTFILIGFGSIGMIVSVLGMFNTLTISLLERTKEIGLMMALGGRNSDMRKLFIFEAALISLLGAVFGIGFAMIGGKFVNFVLNRFAQGRGVQDSFTIFSAPAWAIGALVLFTITVGMIVVWLPARRAQHINPIDALRRE
jgi:putative ABC transport system permease protein